MKRFEALKIQAVLKNLEEVGSISIEAFNEVKQFTNKNKPQAAPAASDAETTATVTISLEAYKIAKKIHAQMCPEGSFSILISKLIKFSNNCIELSEKLGADK